MGTVATLVLLGCIALALAMPDIRRALGRAGAASETQDENVRKFQRWTLIFEVGFALTAWLAAGFLHLRHIDFSAVTTDQVLKAILAILTLIGIPGIYCYLSFRQWQLRRQYRRPDGTLSAADARRIGSLDTLKNLFLGIMAVSLLVILVMR